MNLLLLFLHLSKKLLFFFPSGSTPTLSKLLAPKSVLENTIWAPSSEGDGTPLSDCERPCSGVSGRFVPNIILGLSVGRSFLALACSAATMRGMSFRVREEYRLKSPGFVVNLGFCASWLSAGLCKTVSWEEDVWLLEESPNAGKSHCDMPIWRFMNRFFVALLLA